MTHQFLMKKYRKKEKREKKKKNKLNKTKQTSTLLLDKGHLYIIKIEGVLEQILEGRHN